MWQAEQTPPAPPVRLVRLLMCWRSAWLMMASAIGSVRGCSGGYPPAGGSRARRVPRFAWGRQVVAMLKTHKAMMARHGTPQKQRRAIALRKKQTPKMQRKTQR